MLDKYKRHELPDPHINMNPMIDVVFQLLLFFIIASNFSRPNEIELDLPSSTSAAKPGSESALVISYRPVDGKTELRVNGNSVDDVAHLGQTLRSLASPEKTPAVEIRIDKVAPYQDVIKLMDAVRDAGFPKFSLLTLGSAAGPSAPTPDTPESSHAPDAK